MTLLTHTPELHPVLSESLSSNSQIASVTSADVRLNAVILTRGNWLEAPISELREATVRPTFSAKAGFVLDEHVVRIVEHYD